MAVTANSMDPNYKPNAFRIPDEFWDEVQAMIDEIDIAFDEELIKLKQQESEESSSVKPETTEPKILPTAYSSDDCEIVGVTRIKSRRNSSSYDSSDSGRKEHRSRRDQKKSKKKHRNRSSSGSLERIKEQLRKKLKENELLDEIERLEEEKRRRQRSSYDSRTDYKAVPSTSKDTSYKIRSRSRSRSSERFRSGSKELSTSRNSSEGQYEVRILYPTRRSPSPFSKRSRSPFSKRVSNSPKRYSRSPFRRQDSPNRSRGRSRSISPFNKSTKFGSFDEKRNEEKKKKQSRWSKASPTPQIPPVTASKADSDDENWDDLIPAKPKTSGAGYNIEEVKNVKKPDFDFGAALYDNDDKKGNFREGKFGYKKGGGKSNRVIRIDDDEKDVVMLRPEQKPFMKKSNDKKWEEVMAKNSVPSPAAPKVTLPAPPPPPACLVERIDRAPSEEGELSSNSDEELNQPLPPGVEPTEFLPPKPTIPDAPKPVESFPPLPAPPLPPFSILNDDLPPGVDEIEQDTVLPVVKKASNVKKLREIFEKFMPERDEDEFLPPPMEFISTKPTNNEVKNVNLEETSQKSEKIDEKTEKPSITDTSVLPDTTESIEKIPDVDPSKLLSDEIIKEKQDVDVIYSRIKESIEKSEPPPADIRFLIEEYQPMGVSASGLLYREVDGQQLTIIPESLIEQVISSLHVLDNDSHLNEKITAERLTKRYFWPFMADTVRDFVKNCSKCSQ
ncbi:cyclin-dependent kinase 12-like [Culicoides brevitarsis]|uniref:cyclin-dependent kinase 12-like n=1 Tax=Culicoides brevitarsis TaxID=469753 RepID=UPI00307C6932